ILDFDAGPGGDTLALVALLDGYTAAHSAEFFGIREVNGSTIVTLDADGAGTAFGAEDLLALHGVTGLTFDGLAYISTEVLI
ncbi:MAG: type I secretion C-terminal target domain-containing protein, partial [Hyphomicrobiales bacterium]